jgi:hypothetical protein
MGREANEDAIRRLDEEILKLNRKRNSLLNISTRVPPEILGYIFRWGVGRARIEPSQYPLRVTKGSYNFLLVCHHWLDVASQTPELWTYWGNTLEAWNQQCSRPRSGMGPVDLVVGHHSPAALSTFPNEPLRAALRKLAEDGKIRSLYFHHPMLRSYERLLSALAPDGQSVTPSNIEFISFKLVHSKVLTDRGKPTALGHYADVSPLFTRHHLPKLQYLSLSWGLRMTAWSDLGLHTAALTALDLAISDEGSRPTLAELVSVLASNPLLQTLNLYGHAVPPITEDQPSLRVALPRLKELATHADFSSTFKLLSLLDLPAKVHTTRLIAYDCTIDNIVGALGPFATRFIYNHGADRLEVLVNANRQFMTVEVTPVSGAAEGNTFARFTGAFSHATTNPPPNVIQQCADFADSLSVRFEVRFGVASQISIELVQRIASVASDIVIEKRTAGAREV